MAQHSMLGPSSAHRWSVCTASNAAIRHLYENKKINDTGSVHALEGTIAHELCDRLTRARFVDKGVDEEEVCRRFEVEYSSEYPDFDYDEMRRHALGYVAYIETLVTDANSFSVYSENRLEMPMVHESSFGTGDCIVDIESSAYTEELHIVDFKYGKGVKVDATDNVQLMMYILGALYYMRSEWDELFDVYDKIVAHIYQPRIGNICSWEVSSEKILEAVKTLSAAAEIANNGTGKYVPGIKQCQFCDAKVTCKPYAEYILGDVLDDFEDNSVKLDIKNLSLDEISTLIDKSSMVTTFFNELNAYAKVKAESGTKIPGKKLVAGRPSYSLPEDNEGTVEFLIGKDAYKPLSFKSKTEMLKIAKKQGLGKDIENLFIRREGKPILVDEDDDREEIVCNIDDDFEAI